MNGSRWTNGASSSSSSNSVAGGSNGSSVANGSNGSSAASRSNGSARNDRSSDSDLAVEPDDLMNGAVGLRPRAQPASTRRTGARKYNVHFNL